MPPDPTISSRRLVHLPRFHMLRPIVLHPAKHEMRRAFPLQGALNVPALSNPTHFLLLGRQPDGSMWVRGTRGQDLQPAGWSGQKGGVGGGHGIYCKAI